MCVQPPVEIKLLIIFYVLNLWVICLAFAGSLSMLDESSPAFERFTDRLLEYTQITYGPITFSLSVLGLIKAHAIWNNCEIPKNLSVDYLTITRLDALIILFALICSAGVTFNYALERTEKMAEQSLANESSAFQQIFMGALRREKHSYNEEKTRANRSYLLN
jgi:hypothetical protein